MSRFSIEAIFKAIDAFSKPIAKMRSNFEKFSQQASKSVQAIDKANGKVFDGIAKAAAVTAAGAAIAGVAIKSVVDTGADFEEAITAVGAVSLMTRDEIADLEKMALKLGSTTKFSATEVAQGMELMGRAGFSNAEIMQGMPGILAAAAAEGAGLAETAGNVSNVLKGMGLATTETTRVADVLTLASARTNSSITSLGESMANVASTARQFKIPLEDTVAAVALLQDVGMNASEAGSALNTMLTQMAAPSDKAKKQLKAFGISLQDAHGNMLPLNDVLQQMEKAAQKSGGNMKQVAFFAELVGLRGQKAATNLKDLFMSGKFSSLTKELQGAQGSADKMAKLRMDNFRGDISKLGKAVDAFKIGLFDLNAGPLRGIVQAMTAWIEKNKELITSKIQGFIAGLVDNLPTIVTWIERIGRAAVPLLAMAAAIKVASVAMGILSAVTAASPLTLWIVGLTAAAALIAAFWPEIKAGASAAWNWIANAASKAWDAIVGAVTAAFNFIKSLIVAYLEFGIGFYTMLFSPLLPLLRPIFAAIGAAASWLASQWEPLKAFFADLWAGIVTAFQAAIAFLAPIAQAVVDGLIAIWTPIANFFSGLWEGIKSSFLAAFGWIMDKVGTLLAGVDKIRRIGADVLGDSENGSAAAGGAQVSSPLAGVSRTIEESNTTSRGEVTIVDQTGKAKITKPAKGTGFGLTLQPSGAF